MLRHLRGIFDPGVYFTHPSAAAQQSLTELTESDYTFDVRYKIRKGRRRDGGREGGHLPCIS